MKVVVTLGSVAHLAERPHEGAAHVDVAGVACPGCGKELLQVAGRGEPRRGHDFIEQRAIALCCKRDVGTVAAHFDTLFGLEEDEAAELQVRRGGGKVYG